MTQKFLGKTAAKAIIIGLLYCFVAGCGFFGANVDAPPLECSNKIVKTAYSQLGKKYSAGNATPQKGFDCSGLVWWSYKQHGIKVPRITTDQARTGMKIPRKLAMAGDIMVFRVNNSPRGLHTGIYTGGGKFIHSPSAGKKVCIEVLKPYWNKKLIAIRRVVK